MHSSILLEDVGILSPAEQVEGPTSRAFIGELMIYHETTTLDKGDFMLVGRVRMVTEVTRRFFSCLGVRYHELLP